MQVHYEKTRKRQVKAMTRVGDDTPAWLTICLAKSLKDWLGQACSLSYQAGETQLQLGYEVLSVPVMEFAQTFGPLICRINSVWPVQTFGMADDRELIELSFAEQDGALSLEQRSISGGWFESLQDIYFYVRFPDPLAAACMHRLLDAAVHEIHAVAFDWSFADFLDRQRLYAADRTLSFCYVLLGAGAARERPAACLSGLRPRQKEELWRLFLEKHLVPPEFEWIRDARPQDDVPNWIEWHLALYHTLERLGIRFLCSGGQFELVDGAGKRLYFSVDHANAAEQVLMKILFPINQ